MPGFYSHIGIIFLCLECRSKTPSHPHLTNRLPEYASNLAILIYGTHADYLVISWRENSTLPATSFSCNKAQRKERKHILRTTFPSGPLCAGEDKWKNVTSIPNCPIRISTRRSPVSPSFHLVYQR